MTEITGLSTTDASNTAITGESLNGNVANMSRMDNTLQAILGMLARSIRTNVFSLLDNSDNTKVAKFSNANIPTATTNTYDFPQYGGTLAIASEMRGYLYGLTLSNNTTDATNDIDIAAGTAVDGTGAVSMVLASTLVKRLDAAWAVGTNQGGLDTGSIANTTYHVWLIRRSDTGVVDALFSTSASAPTMPTNYDQKRRIGSIIRASGAIVLFSQRGDEFLLMSTAADVNTSGLSTSAVLYALTIPSGIIVGAIVAAQVYRAGGIGSVLITSPAVTDIAAGGGVPPSTIISPSDQFGSWGGVIRSNTSSQIRARASTAIASFYVTTYGWVDDRGRDG